LLSEADGGVIVVPMAERMEALTASRLTAALDTGAVVLERDGIAASLPAKLGVLALDEGMGEETLSAALADRMAFHCDLNELSIRDMSVSPLARADVDAGRTLFARMASDDALMEVMTALATAFGVSSVRAILFAIRAAQGLAALDGREKAEETDIELAARLVIAPRATRLPVEEQEEGQEPSEAPDDEPDGGPPPSADDSDDPPGTARRTDGRPCARRCGGGHSAPPS
jgi:magnesium chelatase subunit D